MRPLRTRKIKRIDHLVTDHLHTVTGIEIRCSLLGSLIQQMDRYPERYTKFRSRNCVGRLACVVGRIGAFLSLPTADVINLLGLATRLGALYRHCLGLPVSNPIMHFDSCVGCHLYIY